jgi:transglutaminase/protease-like cytokinesis protein 3
VEFFFDYRQTQAELAMRYRATRTAAEEILSVLQLGSENIYTEYEAEKAVHSVMEWFSEHVTADFMPINPMRLRETDTAYGALVERRATALGKAMGFKALCDELGIHCQVVTGQIGEREIVRNLVQIGGNRLEIDIAGVLSDEN